MSTTNAKIDNDEAALAAADEIAALANAVSCKEAALEKRLQAVRDEADVELKPMRASLSERTKALCNYLRRKGVAERLFKPDQKQGESNKAIFGFRNGAAKLSPLDSALTMEDVARKLLSEGLVQYVILPKTTPELNNKAVLAAGLNVTQLAQLGLRSTVSAKFYCELKDAVITKKATTPAS